MGALLRIPLTLLERGNGAVGGVKLFCRIVVSGCKSTALFFKLLLFYPRGQIQRKPAHAQLSNSHYGAGLEGRARHSVRAVRSQAPQDRRARSDAPYQPDKMRIASQLRRSDMPRARE